MLPMIVALSPFSFTPVLSKIAVGYFDTSRNSLLRRCLSRSAWLVFTLSVSISTFTIEFSGFFSSNVKVPLKSSKRPVTQLKPK